MFHSYENVIIIPARYESTRFPGKPLVDIFGKSLIKHVWEKCIQAVGDKHVYIATDDRRIEDHCKEHKMRSIMTSKNCLTGTDRVFEAYHNIPGINTVKTYNNIINVQGDEPLISCKDIFKITEACKSSLYKILCGYCNIKSKKDFVNPNIIKVVMNESNNLMYASRAPIPSNKKMTYVKAYKQVCIYAFDPSLIFTTNKKTEIESIEDIEILRFLEMGEKIQMIEVSDSSISVDIPDDVVKIEKKLKRGYYG